MEQDPTDGTAPPKTKRWQKVTPVVLLVVGFILIPLSAVAIWSHNQLTNTDRYVDTVSPLAGNKDIQQTVAAVVVQALLSQVDVEKRVENAVPKRAKFLGAKEQLAEKAFRAQTCSQQDYLRDKLPRLDAAIELAALTDPADKNGSRRRLQIEAREEPLWSCPGLARRIALVDRGQLCGELRHCGSSSRSRLTSIEPRLPGLAITPRLMRTGLSGSTTWPTSDRVTYDCGPLPNDSCGSAWTAS